MTPEDVAGIVKREVAALAFAMHQRFDKVDERLERLEADVATLKADVRSIRDHLNIDAEQANLASVRGRV